MIALAYPWRGRYRCGDLGGGAPSSAAGAANFTTPIRHIVYVIEENHSFDSILGAWCVKTGRCDGATTGVIYSGSVYPPPDASNHVANPDHSTAGQTEAMDSGAMDGFSLLAGCHGPDYRVSPSFAPATPGLPTSSPSPTPSR